MYVMPTLGKQESKKTSAEEQPMYVNDDAAGSAEASAEPEEDQPMYVMPTLQESKHTSAEEQPMYINDDASAGSAIKKTPTSNRADDEGDQSDYEEPELAAKHNGTEEDEQAPYDVY